MDGNDAVDSRKAPKQHFKMMKKIPNLIHPFQLPRLFSYTTISLKKRNFQITRTTRN